VPICSNNQIPSAYCGNFYDINPFYYKFTCYKAGSLQFSITPNNLQDDYDWDLFDVTDASNSNFIFYDSTLFVLGNFAGTPGRTGTLPGPGPRMVCYSLPGRTTPFNYTPVLKEGHKYVLLVSHFTVSQSGYSISFAGSAAIITDNTQPSVKSASSNCGGNIISIKLAKRIMCASLAPDGSDFAISSRLAKITGAYGVNCNISFDMDSIELTLDNSLPPGTYTVFMKTGIDNNTLLDQCGQPITAGDSATFVVYPVDRTLMDSLVPVAYCSPTSATLVFNKGIKCSSIAADESDFIVTGPEQVDIKNAAGFCDSKGFANMITLNFARPVTIGGTYQIKLLKGSDGNTIIDACNQQVAGGSTINFTTGSAVVAGFGSQVKLGCGYDTIALTDTSKAATAWKWLFNDGRTYNTQNVDAVYTTYGKKSVQLVVSDGECSDTAFASFELNNQLEAQFTAPGILCPEDEAVFKDTSVGKINRWAWYFGDGAASTAQNPPPHAYPQSTGDKIYQVRLIVTDTSGCYDTAWQQLKIWYTCNIAVPTAFTPNGDGLNDYLYPLNAYKAASLHFRVFNRFGQPVFTTNSLLVKWDGTVNGRQQAPGTYVWLLDYIDSGTGQRHFLKGTTLLMR